MDGQVDIVAAIKSGGAVAGIWTFLQAIPFGSILIPVIIVTLIAAFSTTADTMSTTIAALCTKGARHDEEPALWQVAAAVKVFFLEKETKKDMVESEDLIEDQEGK